MGKRAGFLNGTQVVCVKANGKQDLTYKQCTQERKLDASSDLEHQELSNIDLTLVY